MSVFRTLLAAAAAIAIASPVFADDTMSNTSPEATAPTAQTDNNTQASATSSTETKININNASAKELMKVKGLNASKARAIVNYRKKHGNFKSIDDISKVKGLNKLSQDSLKSIEDQLEI